MCLVEINPETINPSKNIINVNKIDPNILRIKVMFNSLEILERIIFGLTSSYWGTNAGGKGVRAKGVDGNWNENQGGVSRTERGKISFSQPTTQSANS